MTLAAAFLALLVNTGDDSPSSTWEVERRVDSMTDKETRLASTTNEHGFSLSFWKDEKGTVWGRFRLPATADVLEHSKPPIFRVDKREAKDLGDAKGLEKYGIKQAEVEPGWVTFRLWNGEGEVFLSPLEPFMTGENVLFRYFLFTGGYKEASFSLAGAREVIAEVLGAEAEPDEERLQKAREEQEAAAKARKEMFAAAESELEACKKLRGRKRTKCVDMVRSCFKMKAAERFQSCMKGQ